MREASAGRARLSWGGDEFLFVEVDEEMSLGANVTVMAMSAGLKERDLPGIIDICPANASMLVRFDPDALPFARLEEVVREVEASSAGASRPLATRVVEVPVWYDDPFTAEVGARFREGYHQAPHQTDLEYAAELNGLDGPAEFIRRHHEQPWLVSMVGFVAGLPFLYQLVERDRQLVVPKYLSPRTDTPRLTVGHGGCFGAIYSVRGAGGYQMFGVVAPPIYDPEQRLPDFHESSVLFRPGDIVSFRPIGREEHEDIQHEVEAGSYRYRQAPVLFDPALALADPAGSNEKIKEQLRDA